MKEGALEGGVAAGGGVDVDVAFGVDGGFSTAWSAGEGVGEGVGVGVGVGLGSCCVGLSTGGVSALGGDGFGLHLLLLCLFLRGTASSTARTRAGARAAMAW